MPQEEKRAWCSQPCIPSPRAISVQKGRVFCYCTSVFIENPPPHRLENKLEVLAVRDRFDMLANKRI